MKTSFQLKTLALAHQNQRRFSVRKLLLASIAGCMLAGSAHAVTIFTDRTSFDAAVGGSTTRTFPASSLGEQNPPFALNSTTFSSTTSPGNRAVIQDGNFNNAIYLYQVVGTSTIRSTMNALGLYIGSVDGLSSFGYTVGGTTGTFTTPNSAGVASSFIGFLDTVPLSVTFNLSSGREFDITSFATQNAPPDTPPVAAVPEPTSWAMMISGFGVIGAAMRRRKTAVATNVRLA